MTLGGRKLYAYIVFFAVIALLCVPLAPLSAHAAGENIALNKTAAASDQEVEKFSAAKAFDGDTKSSSSRWASSADADPQRDGGPHWIYVDLGSVQSVSNVRIFWEQRKAKGYEIQVSTADTVPAADSSEWKTIKKFDSHPQQLTDVIAFDTPEEARFVRLYIKNNTYADPDNGVAWGTVSIFEMEVFSGDIPENIDTVAQRIAVAPPTASTTKLDVTGLTNNGTYTTEFLGADYEQVVGADFSVFKPVIDTEVKLAFKVTNKADKSYVFREIPVTIPGQHVQTENDNSAPQVLPELREWKGASGNFALKSGARVIYSEDIFRSAAQTLADDYADIFGGALTPEKGDASSAKAGDIVLALTKDKQLGLQDEGYLLNVADKVVVTAETSTGAYWATRTILQAAKAADGSIPQGIARDYPLYKVRGFMLDVGRKTFSLEYLKQMAKQMAWYKLNDFHLHLNDNYIWVEEYKGDSVNNAYSGFRLESDIKAGGNAGKNKADLTSKDMAYSKADFASFIRDSAAMGVNIVPEFDMPAHSLAFTKVRPDLRTPLSATHRGADHLDLMNQYDESYAFMTSVWDEYLKGDNPTFAGAKVVHVGADEYEASHQSYRKFVNDIFAHVEDAGHTARIWGSLTQLKNGEAVSGAGRQANIWSTGWANPKEMYDLGFQLINTLDGANYIVPNANYYYDYLNENTMYSNAVNTMASTTIPAGDPQMLGAAFAVWNDMIDKKDTGISEYDVFDRINRALPLHSARLWGKPAHALSLNEAKELAQKTGDSPRTNFHYEDRVPQGEQIAHLSLGSDTDSARNGFDLQEKKNAEVVNIDHGTALRLKGGQSYAHIGKDTPETIGLGHSLRVKVKLAAMPKDTDGKPIEQILFKSPYGTIKAVQNGSGKVGFSREGFDYSFDYALPIGEWVELELRNTFTMTTLFVDGEEVGTLGSPDRTKLKATMMIPFARIGAGNHAFNGYVRDVRIDEIPATPFISLMPLEREIATALSTLADILPETTAADKAALEEAIKAAKAVADREDSKLSAQDIHDAIKNLKAAMNKVKAKGADYSRVDALLAAVPEDLSGYTADSVKNFMKVKEGIVRDLPKGKQSVVNGYEAMLSDAIAALTFKNADISYVDTALLSAAASSHQDSGSDPSKALDGNNATMWHSKWSVTTLPHWFTLTSEEPVEIDGVSIRGRQAGSNGRLNEYVIETSDDGRAWTTVAEGTEANGKNLKDNSDMQVISFEKPLKTKNVRIVWKSSYGNPANTNGSAAEIRLNAVVTDPDTATLEALVKQAEELLKSSSYTPESVQKLSLALKNARDADRHSVQDVNTAIADLRVAMSGLRLKDAAEPVEPTDPTDPVDPVDPSDPENPSRPAEPADPANPSEPADPHSPVESAEPIQPRVDTPSKRLTHSGLTIGMMILASIGLIGAGGVLSVSRVRSRA